MTATFEKFRNVIFCDDIRDEVGNKHSLMGVFSGDIVVAQVPATIKIAVFMQYFPDSDESDKLSVQFRLLQDENEIAKANMVTGDIRAKTVANFVLPQALVIFEKPAVFRILAAVNDGPETEIASKRLILGPTSSTTVTAPLGPQSPTAS